MKNLTNGEMIGLSSSLLDKKRHRPVLLSIPLLAGMVPEIEAAHDGLSSQPLATPDGDASTRELVDLQARERELDQTHDRKAGGAFTMLESAERLSDNADEAARFAKVRAALFPIGSSITQESYISESGNAERVEKLLRDPEVKAALASVSPREGATLLDDVVAFVKAGRSLGALESRKAALTAPASTAAPGDSRATASLLRTEWIQTMNLVVAAARRLKGEHGERFAPVLHEIQQLEAKADERSARNRTAAADPTPDAPLSRPQPAPAPKPA